MSIDTTELKTIYDEFLSKGMAELKDLQSDTQMEDEHLANAASSIIVGAMAQSTETLKAIKGFALLDKQIETEAKKALDIASSTAVRDAQSAQDLLNKASEKARIDEQTALITKQADSETKKALDIASSTAVRDAQSAQDVLNKTAQRELLAKQALKLVQDTLFVTKQTEELGRSVEFNNQIKALNSYADMIGTMGAGGLVISSDMWATFFALIKSLNDNTVTVTYPSTSNTTITKL